MPDVHRTGRVGGHILDIDLLAVADGGTPVGRPLLQDRRHHPVPEGRHEAHVEEARHPPPRSFRCRDRLCSLAASLSAMSRGFILAAFASTMAALQARSPCAASRGGDTSTLERSSPAGSAPSRLQRLQRFDDAALHQRVHVHTAVPAWAVPAPRAVGRCAGLTQFRGSVKQAPVLVDGVAVGHAGHEVGHHGRALPSPTCRRAPGAGISSGSAM